MCKERLTIKMISLFIGFILIASSSHSSDWLTIKWLDDDRTATITAEIPEKMDTPEFEVQIRNHLIDECQRKDKYLTGLIVFKKERDAISTFLGKVPAMWIGVCGMDNDVEKVMSWTDDERKSIQKRVYTLKHTDIELALESFRGRCISPFSVGAAQFVPRKNARNIEGKMFAIGGIKQLSGQGSCTYKLGKSPLTQTVIQLEWKYENLPRDDVLLDGWDENFNQVTLKLTLGNNQLANKQAYRDVFKEIEATILKETGQSPIIN